MKKSIITIFWTFSLLILCTPVPVKAQSDDTVQTHIEYLDTGCYYETTITNDSTEAFVSPFATTKYITKTKNTKYKNASGDVMWSDSIKATFSYDGTTSKCTSCTPSATAYGTTWSIKNVTSSKSGNSATATAKAAHTSSSGASQTYTKSVTIKCSATGVVS